MALEFSSSRLLVPIFGSSIETWGVLIGIILAALTSGYHLGGRLADDRRRLASLSRLCSIIFSAGLYILFIPFAMWPAVESSADPVSLPSLVASTLVLVAAPSVLLGIVSPYAVKLATLSLATLGKKTGNLYSVATAGSIAGTFATVFLLIPAMQMTDIILAIGLALVIPASAFMAGKVPKALAALLLVIAIVFAMPAGGAFSVPLGSGGLNFIDGNVVAGKILYEAQTPYSQLQVVDSQGPNTAGGEAGYSSLRSLYLNGDLHSRMYVERPDELAVTYTRYFPLGFVFNPDAERVLFVGGGGFSGPKYFLSAYPDVQVDVVEIDPVVIEVAKEYFAVPEDEPRLSIYNDDGRRFLLSSGTQYDIIVLDAYSKSYVPFHLMTAEYYRLLDERLAPGGVVVSNHIGSVGSALYNYETSKLWRAAYKTMAGEFDSVQVFPTRSNSGISQNLMLVANDEALSEQEIRERQPAYVKDAIQIDYADRLYDSEIRTDDVPVFTDEYAPVDTFLSPLDNQPYTLETWGQEPDGGVPTESSALNGATLGALVIAGMWILHFRGIWKGGSTG
jgi:spermidine synthase